MDTPRLEVKKFYIFLELLFFLSILFDPTNNKKQSKIVIKRDWEIFGWGWRKLGGEKSVGWVKDRQNTQKPKT